MQQISLIPVSLLPALTVLSLVVGLIVGYIFFSKITAYLFGACLGAVVTCAILQVTGDVPSLLLLMGFTGVVGMGLRWAD